LDPLFGRGCDCKQHGALLPESRFPKIEHIVQSWHIASSNSNPRDSDTIRFPSNSTPIGAHP